jgi:hypothetical protein
VGNRVKKAGECEGGHVSCKYNTINCNGLGSTLSTLS